MQIQKRYDWRQNLMNKYPSPFTQICGPVLKTVQQQFMHYQNTPFCFVEVSHRSANYDRLNNLTVDVIKKYFKAEDYEVLLMPTGSAIPCIYFNNVHPDSRLIFYSEGEFSHQNYKQIRNYHPQTEIVHNKEDLANMLAQENFKGKNIVHFNKVDDGKQINLQVITEKNKKDVILVKNINYCFPWTQNAVMTEDIVYFDTQTGFSIPGFAVILIRKELISKMGVIENCPDMFDFLFMLKMKSVVNTPFTLCTLVLYENLKYAYENKQKIYEETLSSKRIYEKVLQKIGCKSTIDNEEDSNEAFNFIKRNYSERQEELINQLSQMGWVRKQNREICLFIQNENSDPSRLWGKLMVDSE